MPGRLPPSHVLPGKNRSISARKCCQAGSCSGSRWLLLSSGTRRLPWISAASNLDCSNRLSGSRREHIIRGCRAPLKLVETAPLLLGGLRQEAGYEDLPVHRVRTAPAQPDDLNVGFGEVKLVGGAGALAPALGVGTEQHQVTDAFGVAHRVRDGDGPALRYAEQREPVEPSGVDDGLQVVHPVVEREPPDVPIRQPATSLVVPDEAEPA